ncbi:ER membrane protein complex subunit 1 [Impatiens glandulifera]|uniref:ER membrane protein complex subunit 1 n=1 Tax=Impatiens glandulifera TaxID=253017 RepID=UPI001FB12CC5|nr:ER membrane protein complex subunit 1 [Impatiens glandulifera]
MAIRVFVVLFILLSSSYTISSLYEDQVGLMDWHQQYIGKVKHAVFHTQKAGRKRVVVSTEENVVASLDLRRGEIYWRHVLGAGDVIDQIDIALGKYVITLSSAGSTLRAWNLPDGQMAWESSLSGSKPSNSFLLVPGKSEKDTVIIAYGNGCLHAISSVDGELLWKKELDEGIEIQQLVQPFGSELIYAVGYIGSSQFAAYQINADTGDLLKYESEASPGGFSGEIVLVSGETFVAFDATQTHLVSVKIRNGKISFQQTHISNIVDNLSGKATLLQSKLAGIFGVNVGTYTTFVKVTDEGQFVVLSKTSHAAALSDVLPISDGHFAFSIIQLDGDKIQQTVKDVEDWGNDFLIERIDMTEKRGLVHKVFLNNYIKTDRSYGFRALVVMEDHSLLLLQQGEIVWTREDGLASIIDVTTSELPIEKQGVSVAKVEQTLFEWLKGHLLKVKGTLMLATPDEVAEIQKIRLQSSGKSKMTRDHNGFRKLLIVLSKSGKIFALHTGDGRIVWSQLLRSLQKSEGCEFPVGLNLYHWQVPHHHALDENPSVLVVGRCGSKLDNPGVLSVVDVYTGNEVNPWGHVHSISQVVPLPFTDSTEQRLHLLIDTHGNAHLYPTNTEALEIFQREFTNVYWYSVEADTGIIKGHTLKSTCTLEVEDKYCFSSRDLWSIVFPSESEKIIATVTRKPNEVVHTQAKVMAEQELMYKYISKNLVFVATVTPKASGEIGSATPDESQLVVYLIDTVTGRILNRMVHHGSQGPVHAVFSENWVVYHYFNLRAHRYEMSVIEIYDQSRADNKDVLKLIVGKHNLTSPVSSYSRPEILTKSQSYFFAHTVKVVAVTSTAKGITSRHLLIGTVGDQVLALDKRFVDPRRTANPTQAEREEGLVPLTDSLPIIPQSYVTHGLKVEGLRGIVTIPTKLESTSLVFTYGVDLFFTRIAPSKTYDSLTEDFSYALLLITIFVLLVAIFVTWYLSEKKELEEKWR